MSRIINTILFLSLVPFCCLAQESKPNLSVERDTLAKNMYRIFIGHGGAVTVLTGEEGTLLVDDATAAATEVLKEELDTLKCTPVKYIINTHWHGDHTGGNATFGKKATIIAHENVKKLLENDEEILGQKRPASPAWALPSITFSERLNLEFNGYDIQVIHLPGGHTDGDAIVWFPQQKILAAGDLLFADAFPFVDTAHGGNPLQYIQNVNWITGHFPQETRIIGGHGRIYSMSEMTKYSRDLARTADVVKRSKAAGMSKEQMKKAGILNDWASYGTWWITADMWIDTLYGYLAKP